MDNARIKEILLDIRSCDYDFTVTMTGKASKQVNGLYKPENREILLHNKNFKTDEELIYTAIHEYAHHLVNEADMNRAKTQGLPVKKPTRVHNNEFWTLFHELLMVAEQKGYYKIALDTSPALEELTQEIREKYIKGGGDLMVEFGKLLIKAHNLCKEAGVRYEDYIDRVLCLPRGAAKSLTKVAASGVDTSIGYENMKMVARTKDKQLQAQAVEQLEQGKSPDTVSSMMKSNKRKAVDPEDEADMVKLQLEKEKSRLERTIGELQKRLDAVEASLATM